MNRRLSTGVATAGAAAVTLALVATLLWLRGAGAPSTSHGGPVRDYVSLVDHLRATGAIVTPQVAPQTKFWDNADAFTILVNGERVDVYQFDNALDATLAAAQIGDGGGRRQTGPGSAEMIDWVAPPHFFRADRVIALYIGRAASALSPLHLVMGAPFAEEQG